MPAGLHGRGVRSQHVVLQRRRDVADRADRAVHPAVRLGQCRHPVDRVAQVGQPCGIAVAVLLQAAERVVTDRLEQAVATAVVRRSHGDQRLVDQGGEEVDRVGAVPGPPHRVRPLEVERRREHREPAQHRRLLLVEQVEAPGDRGLEGPLACHRPAAAAPPSRPQQPEAVVETRLDLTHGQHPRACGSQLDRQRQPVQTSTDLGDRSALVRVETVAVDRRGTVQEQAGRRVGLERRQGRDLLGRQPQGSDPHGTLAGHVQRLARRREHTQP